MRRFILRKYKTRHGQPKYRYQIIDPRNGKLLAVYDKHEDFVAAFVQQLITDPLQEDQFMIPFFFTRPENIGAGYSATFDRRKLFGIALIETVHMGGEDWVLTRCNRGQYEADQLIDLSKVPEEFRGVIRAYQEAR